MRITNLIRVTYVVNGEEKVTVYNNKGRAKKEMNRLNAEVKKIDIIVPEMYGKRVVWHEQEGKVKVRILRLTKWEEEELYGARWAVYWSCDDYRNGEWTDTEVWVDLEDAKTSGIAVAYRNADSMC